MSQTKSHNAPEIWGKKGGSLNKTVRIEGRFYGEKTLPSLNNLLAEYGRHPNAGNKMKQDCMWICIAAIRKCLKSWKVENPPVILHYRFYEPSNGQKRDVMNVMSMADKCFEDALTKCGTIENDNPDWIINTTHEFYYTDKEPWIEIEIEEKGVKI